MQIQAGNHHTSLVQCPLCCKYWSQVDHQVIFYSTTKCSTYLAPSVIPSKKHSHIPSSGPSYHPNGSPSVAMCVHTSPFPSIKPKSLPSCVTSDKTSDNPIIHPLNAPTGFLSLIPYIQASKCLTHVKIVHWSSRPSNGPYHIQILNTIINSSVSLSQTLSDPPSAHSSPFILEFSQLHLTINFESTDSIFSTNDVGSATAEFLDGYLRSYFKKSTNFYALISHQNKSESSISTSSPVPSKDPTKHQPLYYPPIQVHQNNFSLSQIQLIIQL